MYVHWTKTLQNQLLQDNNYFINWMFSEYYSDSNTIYLWRSQGVQPWAPCLLSWCCNHECFQSEGWQRKCLFKNSLKKKITKATWTCLASCVKMVFWKGGKSSLCLLLVTLIMGSANQRKEGCRDHFRWTHWGSTYTWRKVMDFWECKDPDPHPHSCSQLQTATSSPAQPLLTP